MNAIPADDFGNENMDIDYAPVKMIVVDASGKRQLA